MAFSLVRPREIKRLQESKYRMASDFQSYLQKDATVKELKDRVLSVLES